MKEKSKALILEAENILNRYILREKRKAILRKQTEIRLLVICLFLNIILLIVLIFNNI